VATFANHWLEEARPTPMFTGAGGLWSQAMSAPVTGLDLLAYVLRFDHLLCVPAMIFFVLGLKCLPEETP
jgi:Gpi18-like mannosyltransferase